MADARGSARARDSYDKTELDLNRLIQYAKKVARECRSTPIPERTRRKQKSVPDTVTRRAGLLGLRTEVAQVTRTVQVSERVIGPHWVLRRTNHHIESQEAGKAIEYHEQNYWVLQEDGTLSKVWEWEEFTRWPDGTTRVEQDCTATPMTEADILRLDHLDRQYDNSDSRSGTKIWGNREPGKRIRHAKGVGLSMALKELLG
ncbi:hypothetical protein AB0A74_03010 [Saccharothrix sp. NPDC042600]|uniref:hypothetical protein n=1 Tax=Saccharothrix TaxID=2071 RepID=UPI0033D1DF57|nr:hypothetical protein GCM10017745_67450 [Saccharothrix mutabilis subsp. capreolus]